MEEVSQVSFVHRNKVKASERTYPHNKVTLGCALSVISSSSGEWCTVISSETVWGTLGVYVVGRLLRLRIRALVATVKEVVAVGEHHFSATYSAQSPLRLDFSGRRAAFVHICGYERLVNTTEDDVPRSKSGWKGGIFSVFAGKDGYPSRRTLASTPPTSSR